MQFLTGTVTEDVDYLLYLLLKKPKTEVKNEIAITTKIDESFINGDFLEEWFNNL